LRIKSTEGKTRMDFILTIGSIASVGPIAAFVGDFMQCTFTF